MKQMYKCCECGKLFEEPDTIQEYRGEFWGTPAYEPVDVSPCCEADFEEYEPTCKDCNMFTGCRDTRTGECEYFCGWLETEIGKDDEPCKDFELNEDNVYDRGMDRV